MATTQRGIGFFSKEKQAEQAIRALETAQFPMDQVSIVAKELQQDTVAAGAQTGHTVQGQDVNNPKKRPEQANASAFWGGLVGGFGFVVCHRPGFDYGREKPPDTERRPAGRGGPDASPLSRPVAAGARCRRPRPGAARG